MSLDRDAIACQVLNGPNKAFGYAACGKALRTSADTGSQSSEGQLKFSLDLAMHICLAANELALPGVVTDVQKGAISSGE